MSPVSGFKRAGMLALLLACACGTVLADNGKPVRGKLLRELDATPYTLGALCVSPAGEVYTENDSGRANEILKLSSEGRVLWRVAAFDKGTVNNSVFGGCAAGGVSVAIHGRGPASDGPKSRVRGRVLRLADSSAVVWDTELSVPGCEVLLFALAADAAGNTLVGGSIDRCADGTPKRGFVQSISPTGQAGLPRITPGIESVRQLLVDGDRLSAAGPDGQAGFSVLRSRLDGVELWSRSQDDLQVEGEINGMVRGERGGLWLCLEDYESKQVQLLQLDPLGRRISDQAYGNRSAAGMGRCLIEDARQQQRLLLTESGGEPDTQLELRLIDSAGRISEPSRLENKLSLSRGFGLASDASALYVGGSSGAGRSRPAILRYPLAFSPAAVAARPVCETAPVQAQIATRKAEVQRAAAAADQAIAQQLASMLAERHWTPQQVAQFRQSADEDLGGGYRQAQLQSVADRIQRQLKNAAAADCDPILQRLNLQYERIQSGEKSRAELAVYIVRNAVLRHAPSGAELSAQDLQRARSLWARKFQDRILKNWKRPPGESDGKACTVEITVQTDGSVTGASIVETSGIAEFDQSVLAAVRSASPFPPPEVPQAFMPKLRMRLVGG